MWWESEGRDGGAAIESDSEVPVSENSIQKFNSIRGINAVMDERQKPQPIGLFRLNIMIGKNFIRTI